MRIALPDRPAPARRLTTPRLVALLALLVLSATFFCAIVGYVLVRQADDRQALERRAALLGAIEDIRSAGADFADARSPPHPHIERIAGLKDLRFETEPAPDGREIQSVLDGQGRIIGWFSWQPDRSMSNALGELRPLLVADRRCSWSALPASRSGRCGAPCATWRRASSWPGRWRTRTCSPACPITAR